MTKSNFLPKGYETPPTPSNYMKLEDGKNTFRVLSSAVVGWEWWDDDDDGKRRPNRVKTQQEIPDIVKSAKDNNQKAKHFWAFVVYNFGTEQIQILEIPQKTIQRSIEAMVDDDENWGDPKDYNIIITRVKTGSRDQDVEYSVMPQPKKPLDQKIIDIYSAANIRLEALFDGADPFEEVVKSEEVSA